MNNEENMKFSENRERLVSIQRESRHVQSGPVQTVHQLASSPQNSAKLSSVQNSTQQSKLHTESDGRDSEPKVMLLPCQKSRAKPKRLMHAGKETDIVKIMS